VKTLKVWGSREVLYNDGNVGIHLLRLVKDGYSSWHSHKSKSDKFILISGEVKIATELGETVLKAGDSLVVDPPLMHQFIVSEDSVMVEISYSKLDPEDIIRLTQGGKMVDGKKVSLDELNRMAKENCKEGKT